MLALVTRAQRIGRLRFTREEQIALAASFDQERSRIPGLIEHLLLTGNDTTKALDLLAGFLVAITQIEQLLDAGYERLATGALAGGYARNGHRP